MSRDISICTGGKTSVQLSEPTLLPCLLPISLSLWSNSCCYWLSVSHAIDHVLIAQLYNPAFLTDPLLPCSLQRSSGDTNHCLRRRFPKISCQTTESTMPMIHEQMDRNKCMPDGMPTLHPTSAALNQFRLNHSRRSASGICPILVSSKSPAIAAPLSLKTQLDSQAQLILRRPKGKSGKSEQTNYDVRD
ncbi:hypothetical protein BDW75DRAFT_97590 [Aspergillus navahoensis]